MPKPRNTRLTLAKVAILCAGKPGSARTTPFGPEPVVYKVGGRMFALLGHLHGNAILSLKCDPERSLVLRSSYPSIVPGYHLNKEHWNTLVLDGSLPAALVAELIDHSHTLASQGRSRGRTKRTPGASRPRARVTSR